MTFLHINLYTIVLGSQNTCLNEMGFFQYPQDHNYVCVNPGKTFMHFYIDINV